MDDSNQNNNQQANQTYQNNGQQAYSYSGSPEISPVEGVQTEAPARVEYGYEQIRKFEKQAEQKGTVEQKEFKTLSQQQQQPQIQQPVKQQPAKPAPVADYTAGITGYKFPQNLVTNIQMVKSLKDSNTNESSAWVKVLLQRIIRKHTA